MDVLAKTDMKTMVEKAGVPGKVADIFSKAGMNTSSLVALSGSTDVAFLTAMRSALGDTVVPDWQLSCIKGYVSQLVEKEDDIVQVKEDLNRPKQVDDEEMKELMALQAELGIQSLTVPMSILKALLTDIGPDAIDVKPKVVKAILNARKGKVGGEEVVLQVSGSGDVMPRMAAGLGVRKVTWALARRDWSGLMSFSRKVRKILARMRSTGSSDEADDALTAWDNFVEYLADLEEIKGAKYAAEYFVAYTTEFDFTFQLDDGNIRPVKDEKIKMMAARMVRKVKPMVDSDDDDELPFPKQKHKKSVSKGPCLKCGQGHGVFHCPSRCKTNGCCVICGKKRDVCKDMFECAERSEESK